MNPISKQRGLRELYAEDPERADWLLFGRRPCADRRGFLRGAGLATMGAVLGAGIPFHRSMPAGLIPVALADTDEAVLLETKDGLTILKRPADQCGNAGPLAGRRCHAGGSAFRAQ